MSEIKPVAYFKATEKHGILWGEDCCCVDPVYGDYEDHEGQEVVNLAVYPAAAYEALQKENERLTKCLIAANANHEKFERQYYLELNKVEDFTEESAAHAKRIAELEEKLQYCTNTAC